MSFTREQMEAAGIDPSLIEGAMKGREVAAKTTVNKSGDYINDNSPNEQPNEQPNENPENVETVEATNDDNKNNNDEDLFMGMNNEQLKQSYAALLKKMSTEGAPKQEPATTTNDNNSDKGGIDVKLDNNDAVIDISTETKKEEISDNKDITIEDAMNEAATTGKISEETLVALEKRGIPRGMVVEYSSMKISEGVRAINEIKGELGEDPNTVMKWAKEVYQSGDNAYLNDVINRYNHFVKQDSFDEAKAKAMAKIINQEFKKSSINVKDEVKKTYSRINGNTSKSNTKVETYGNANDMKNDISAQIKSTGKVDIDAIVAKAMASKKK